MCFRISFWAFGFNIKGFLQNACFGISFWAAFVLLWGRLGGALGQVRARHGTFLAEASLWEPAFGHFPAALEGSKTHEIDATHD